MNREEEEEEVEEGKKKKIMKDWKRDFNIQLDWICYI